MNDQFIRTVKGQSRLPRWFSSVFKMIMNPKSGSLIIQLPDGRKFYVESENPGANAYIIVRNGHLDRKSVV